MRVIGKIQAAPRFGSDIRVDFVYLFTVQDAGLNPVCAHHGLFGTGVRVSLFGLEEVQTAFFLVPEVHAGQVG